MKVASLFSGIGGMELGLAKSGHATSLLVEIDPAANAVLSARFPGIERAADVRDSTTLPAGTEILAAGFPCQDLSQAGQTAGIQGSRSGLVGEVFRLAAKSRVPWILFENVPFMLQLNRGEAIRQIVDELEAMGYAWAYRKIDTRAFGLPQRRERIFLLASLAANPAELLFADDHEPAIPTGRPGMACGFYWTEGTRGLGWAADAVPTLKGGSSVGIPSPPASWIPGDGIYTPDIRDCERLQGFDADWTKPAEGAARPGYRWKLVGNAVSVPAAEWVGALIGGARTRVPLRTLPLAPEGKWPNAAFGGSGARRAVSCSTWPVAVKPIPLAGFLQYPLRPLSERAATGFHSRLTSGRLRYSPEFREALERHLAAAISGCWRTGTPPSCSPP